MEKILKFSAVMSLSLCSAAGANTNGLKNPVNQLATPGSFEVVNKWSARDSYIWCSAAKEARRMGADYHAKVYVVRGLGPSVTSPGNYGVVFSLRPSAELTTPTATSSGAQTSSLHTIGSYMSVTQGQRLCVREIDN